MKLVFLCCCLIWIQREVLGIDVVQSSFPMAGDYNAERARVGGDPPTYSKTYHRILPGGHEHGEVNAFNGPGSNSFSSSYQKSQSFGNISPSYGSSSSSFSSGVGGVSPDASVALANHNAILTNMQRMHQDNMMSMGMGMPTTIYGTHKFSPYADPPVVIESWMDQHMKFMENMMKFQQKQFETIQAMILDMQKSMVAKTVSSTATVTNP